MKYNYTAYYNSEEERIKAVADDILTEYPNLGILATEAAKMEKPFGRVHEDYWDFSEQANHINRLIDIVIVTEGKPQFSAEYEKACKDLASNFNSWKDSFTYANPEEQAVYYVMQRFQRHLEDPSIPLVTVKQADEIIDRDHQAKLDKMKWLRDHTMQYNFTSYYRTDEERIKAISDDILREYPNLGVLAIEAAKLERPFGSIHEDYWEFSSQENHINRLIDIIIVTEGKAEYTSEFQKACSDLEKNFDSWIKCYSYANPEKQPAYILMTRYKDHFTKHDVPLITYNEAYDISYSLDEEQNRSM